MPIRINSETGKPEWKDVGADTWHPFKSSIATDNSGLYCVYTFSGNTGALIPKNVLDDDDCLYVLLQDASASALPSVGQYVTNFGANYESICLIFTNNIVAQIGNHNRFSLVEYDSTRYKLITSWSSNRQWAVCKLLGENPNN